MSVAKETLKSAAFKAQHELEIKRHGQIKFIWTALIILTSALMGFLLLRNDGFRRIERRVTWPLQFQMRDKLSRTPQMDPRLRVLMLDDSTVQLLKRPNLNFREWSSLLSYLDKHKPASIYIDKVFGLLDEDAASIQQVLPTLRMLRTRVSLAGFTSTNKIPFRELIDTNASQFKARAFLPDSYSDISEDSLERILMNSGFKDRSSSYSYGPVQELRSIFQLGHIDYPYDNETYPIYRMRRMQIFPSLPFSGRVNLKIESGGPTVLGKKIPLNKDGALLVNWLPPGMIYSQALPVATAFEAMRSGQLWAAIPDNAHILILPEAFTGNSDFKMSPYGLTLGGMIHVASLNSILTNKWLAELKNPELYLLAALLMVSLLQLIQGMRAWYVLLIQVVAIVAGGCLAFIYASVDVPWLTGVSLVSFAGTATLSVRSLWESRRERMIKYLEKEYSSLEAEEKRLERELADAERVAAVIKPEDDPNWPGYWISTFHKSLTPASGDWYFFQKSQSGRYGHFVLCDITGHGVQAGLVVASCKTVLSGLRIDNDSIFESHKFVQSYAERLNRILFIQGKGRHSTTLVGITFDLHNNDMYFLNCGHPFPICHSSGQQKNWAALVGKISDPLGFSEDILLEPEKRKLETGDVIVLHSDGVALNRNRRILRRFFEEMDAGIRITAKRLNEAVSKESQKMSHDPTQDDASLVIFLKEN